MVPIHVCNGEGVGCLSIPPPGSQRYGVLLYSLAWCLTVNMQSVWRHLHAVLSVVVSAGVAFEDKSLCYQASRLNTEYSAGYQHFSRIHNCFQDIACCWILDVTFFLESSLWSTFCSDCQVFVFQCYVSAVNHWKIQITVTRLAFHQLDVSFNREEIFLQTSSGICNKNPF